MNEQNIEKCPKIISSETSVFSCTEIIESEEKPPNILFKIFQIASPTLIYQFTVNLQSTIIYYFLNKRFKSDTELSGDIIEGIGFCYFLFDTTLNSIMNGLSSGFEIMGSQCLGSKKYKLLGLYLWRARIICFMAFLLFSTILTFAMIPLMSAIGKKETEKYYAQRFLYSYAFLYLFQSIDGPNYTYNNIAGKSYVNAIIMLSTSCFQILHSYIFIIVLDLDALGAGFSVCLTTFLNSFFSTFYIVYFQPIPNSVFFITKKCFKDLYSYLRISLPTTILYYIQWSTYELSGYFALFLNCFGERVILANLYNFLYAFIGGFQSSTTIMVSSEIGENNESKAKRYFKYNIISAFVCNLIIATIFFLFSDMLLRLYTYDEEVIKMTKPVMFILSLSFLADTVQTILSSFTKSCGKIYATTIISFVMDLLLQILFMFLFGYVAGLNLYGIYLGNLSAFTILIVCFTVLAFHINFKEAISDTNENLLNDDGINTSTEDTSEHGNEDNKKKKEDECLNENENDRTFQKVNI